MQYSLLVCKHLDEEEIADCFTIIVSLVSCDFKCFMGFPHSAVSWSAVCDCGISRSYYLIFGVFCSLSHTVLSSFCDHLAEEKVANFLTLIDFLLLCGC